MEHERERLATLESAIRIIEHFRTLDAEYPAQIMVLLLHVARSPGSSMSSLADRIGTSLPAVSRNIERLGVRWGPDREGEGLVEVAENPADRREKLVQLSPKGDRFIEKLVSLAEK